MQVTATQVEPTPSGLSIGCVVSQFEGGPVRFTLVKVPWSLMSRRQLADLQDSLLRHEYQQLEDEPLF